MINTEVSLTHTPDLDNQAIKYELLKRKDSVAASIENLGSGDLTVHYVGDMTLEVLTTITLRGVPEQEMGTQQIDFFEKFARSFLNRQFQGNEDSSRDVEVLTVRVKQQEVYTDDRNLRSRLLHAWGGAWQRHRRVSISSDTSIDITTTITGEHRPPPQIEFDSLVEDSVNLNSYRFEQELKTEAHQSLDISEAFFFEEVKGAMARTVLNIMPTAAPTAAPTPELSVNATNVTVAKPERLFGFIPMEPNVTNILIIVGSGVGMLTVFSALCYYRTQKLPASEKASVRTLDMCIGSTFLGEGARRRICQTSSGVHWWDSLGRRRPFWSLQSVGGSALWPTDPPYFSPKKTG